MSALLLVQWREQHPQGHEQTMLQFATQLALPEPVALFLGRRRNAKLLIAQTRGGPNDRTWRSAPRIHAELLEFFHKVIACEYQAFLPLLLYFHQSSKGRSR